MTRLLILVALGAAGASLLAGCGQMCTVRVMDETDLPVHRAEIGYAIQPGGAPHYVGYTDMTGEMVFIAPRRISELIVRRANHKPSRHDYASLEREPDARLVKVRIEAGDPVAGLGLPKD